MAVTYTLVLTKGADWSATMTYRKSGVVTAVVSPVAEIRDAPRQDGELVLRMTDLGLTPMITQTTPGVLNFLIPASVIANLEIGRAWWDLFGVVDGVRTKLIGTSGVEIVESVTVP